MASIKAYGILSLWCEKIIDWNIFDAKQNAEIIKNWNKHMIVINNFINAFFMMLSNTIHLLIQFY